MDRNTVIGFVLLGVLFVGFFMVQNHYAQIEEAKQVIVQDSLNRVHEANRIDSLNRAIEQQKQVAVQAQSMGIDSTHLSPTQIAKVQDSITAIKIQTTYGPFATAAKGNEQLSTLENDFLKIEFTNRGGKIKTCELKKYKDFNGGPLDLINGDNNKFGYSFYYDTDKLINTDSLYFTALPSSDAKSITFRLDAGDGKYFDQIYAFNDTDYLVNYSVKLTNFDKIIPSKNPVLLINWQNEMHEQERNLEYERRYSSNYFSYASGDVDYKSANGDIKFDSKVKWVSCQQQFFNATLIAKNNFDKGGNISVYAEDSSRFVKLCNAELYLPYNNTASFEFPMQFYLAPNNYSTLKSLDIGLEDIVPTGTSIFRWVNRWIIIPLFHWLGSFMNNYGLIILLLTVIIKLVLSPLTYRSYLSMAKMRVVQPEIAELREKYKDDQARLGQEQMKLYRKAGVNPLGGCLPTLLSMPILISLFRFFPGSIELRQQSFLWAKDLSSYDDVLHWNASLPFIGNHLSIFTVLMTISSLLYIRMNMANSTGITGPMKTMQYIFPFFLMFFLNNSPAGLTYYYFVSNMTTFGMQWGIRKFLINEKDLHRKIEENKTKPVKKSKFQQRLEDAMKQQQQLKSGQPKKKK